MKKLLLVLVLMGGLSGCATLDGLLGVNDDAPATELSDETETLIDLAEDTVGPLIPVPGGPIIIGLGLSGLAIVYRAVRKATRKETS